MVAPVHTLGILAAVAVPLLIVGFFVTRRATAAGEHLPNEDEHTRELIEQEFAESEEYQAAWREEERKHKRDTLL
jgi:hypothetical protein